MPFELIKRIFSSEKDAFPEGALILRDKLARVPSSTEFNPKIKGILKLIGTNKISEAKKGLKELTAEDVAKNVDLAGAWICIKFVTKKTVNDKEKRGEGKEVILLKPGKAEDKSKITKRTDKLELQNEVVDKLKTNLSKIDLNIIKKSIRPLTADRSSKAIYSKHRHQKNLEREEAAKKEYSDYLGKLNLEDFDETNPTTRERQFNIDAFKEHFKENLKSELLKDVANYLISRDECTNIQGVINHLSGLREWVKGVNFEILAKKLEQHIEEIDLKNKKTD